MPHTLLLHSALEKEGYDIKFWYINDKISIYPWEEQNEEKKYFVVKRKKDLFSLLKDCLKSDLVIISGWQTPSHIFILIACWILGKKTAIWGDTPEKPRNFLNKIVKKQLLRTFSFYLFTGKIASEKLFEYYNITSKKIRVFPYLNAVFDNHEIEKINEERIKSLNNGSPIKLLISNRFIERKGYDCIFRSFEKLKENGCLLKYSITILGDGPEYSKYKKLFDNLNTSISFNKWVEYREYLEYIKNTDIFLHASTWEPYGIPPMDAMNCGKLVVVSDGVMSAIDRIQNGKNGFIFKADDDNELTQILTEMVEHPSLVYKIGEQAHTSSLMYFPSYNVSVIKELLK
jgi:glycosyltransferase involved in cell wall biosynthesis